MKYLEFTFHTTPCTEIVNDVLSAVLGEAGFESFVEQTGLPPTFKKIYTMKLSSKKLLPIFPYLIHR